MLYLDYDFRDQKRVQGTGSLRVLKRRRKTMRTLQEIKIEVSDEGHLFVNGVDTHKTEYGGNHAMMLAYENGYIIEVYSPLSGAFGPIHSQPSWNSSVQYRTVLLPVEPKKTPMTREDIETLIVSKRTFVRRSYIAGGSDPSCEWWLEITTEGQLNRVIKEMARHEYSHDLKVWHKFEKEETK
jgi:hypothetical protein